MASSSCAHDSSAGRPAQLATRLIFLASGMAAAAWAPLVPFARMRLGKIDDGTLGMLLLCIGAGSIVAMPITGLLTSRIGCRRVILVSGIMVILVFPALAALDTLASMAIALAVFGAGLGSMDVAMNVQAVIVERDSRRPMMSGFHALFSVGGFAGAGGVSAMLATGVVSPLIAACLVSTVLLALVLAAVPALLTYGDEGGIRQPLFVLPQGSIVFVGVLCLLALLLEGAMQDWSAVFLSTLREADPAISGMAFAMFAAAMTLGRFAGNHLRTSLGEDRLLAAGALLAAAGLTLVALAPVIAIDLAGFAIVGLGASNIVPILFSIAGRNRIMPAGLAIASLTTLGYFGLLAGPALIGFVAKATSLQVSFLFVALAMVLIAVSVRIIRI